MALQDNTIQHIIDLKSEDENNRDNPKFKGVLLSNRDISEVVFGVRSSESTVRRVWKKYKQQGHYQGVVGDNPIAGGTVETPDVKRKVLSGKKFVITSAQNNTYVHTDFLKSLEVYCEEEGAELLISCFYYNKNGFQNGKREGAWFDDRIKPYLVNESVQLAKGLVFCGEMNILPTAVNPISGLHNYTGENSCILPHAKLQMESVPTPKHEPSRMIYTTGCTTLLNYVPMKSGLKAAYHHTYAALVVEVDSEGDWFVRQLNCESKTGQFYDLGNYYTPKGKTSGHNIEAVNYGDLHGISIAPEVEYACWEGKGNILDTLKPKYQFLHDSMSNERRNHHNLRCPLYMFTQHTSNAECVREEVELTTNLIAKLDRPYSERVVVDSNHDRSIQRWILEQDFKKDPVNAIFMLELTLDLFKATRDGLDFHTFENACRRVDPRMNTVRFLRQDESFKICGKIECGAHSDTGNNGGRGSVMAFQRAGLLFNIGHSHQATIKDGVFQSGMSGNLEQGYNKGNSSWNHSHILTYPNGKRTIVTQKGSKWRGL
ncbi:hypothetical protein NVP1063O_172 [Vibrio phage 1.063.O._10N.261.45.C7]|nr:hypothetical protein NVP1063O_172 [Vibrio phage 1.063.O._10N.261.45.C7]